MNVRIMLKVVRAILLLFALLSGVSAVTIGGAQSARADSALEAWSALQRGAYTEAYNLIKPLAEEGATWAQVNLGLMYAQGQGVDQNYDEALKWFRAAASKGDATAQSCMGRMYEEGHGIPIDYVKAAHWYLKAANQGLVWAQTHIGQMFFDGQGVPEDPIRALMWFHLAADAGDYDAKQLRDTTASCLSPEQINEAEELVRQWKAKHED